MSRAQQLPRWIATLNYLLVAVVILAYLWFVTWRLAWPHGLGWIVGSVVVGMPVLGVVGPLLSLVLIGPLMALHEYRKAATP